MNAEEEVTQETGVPERRMEAMKLTERDRDLFAMLVMARYLSVTQVHRLMFPGKRLALAYRRLQKLSAPMGQEPFVRQTFFRTYDGRRLSAFAATSHSVPAAVERTSQLRELPKHDVGARHMEHLLQTNELLVSLWSGGNRPARARHPHFRWIPSDAVRLPYGGADFHHGRAVERVILPDAVLESPTLRRRWFLECEMGSHTIVPESPEKPGATLNKMARYQSYLGKPDPVPSRYENQYSDRFAPEVLFLVLTPGRAKSVNVALDAWRAGFGGTYRPAAARAVTFEAAGAELRAAAGLAPLNPRPPAAPVEIAQAPVSASGLARAEIEMLWQYVYDASTSLKAARAAFRALGRTDLPEYPRNQEQVVAWVQGLIARKS